MGDYGVARHRHAQRRLRPRRAARRGGDRDAGYLPVGAVQPPKVVLYSAQGCHLCDRARAVLDTEGTAYAEIDITGVPELEAAYREWLPVVEIEGERAFVYHVQPAGLRRKLGLQSRPD